MLKLLSYLNIILAFLYFIIYLQNGSYYLIGGLMVVLFFNWQILKRLETERFNWRLLQYVSAIISFIVCGFLLFSAWNLIASSIENHYYNFDLIVLETFSLVFGISIGWHCIKSFLKSLKA